MPQTGRILIVDDEADKTLEHTGGSTSRAAQILGTSLRNIQYKLQKYQQTAHSPKKPRRGSGD